jgi:phosphoribosylamine-glycine ligase
VVGAGDDLGAARAAAYRRAGRITFPGVRYRDDIGVVRPKPLAGSVS